MSQEAIRNATRNSIMAGLVSCQYDAVVGYLNKNVSPNGKKYIHNTQLMGSTPSLSKQSVHLTSQKY